MNKTIEHRGKKAKKKIKSLIIHLRDNKKKSFPEIGREVSKQFELDFVMSRQLAYYHYSTGKEFIKQGRL